MIWIWLEHIEFQDSFVMWYSRTMRKFTREEKIPCITQGELNYSDFCLMSRSKCPFLVVVHISCEQWLLPCLLYSACAMEETAQNVCSLWSKASIMRLTKCRGSSCSRSDGEYMRMSQCWIKTKNVIHGNLSNVHVGMCWAVDLSGSVAACGEFT